MFVVVLRMLKKIMVRFSEEDFPYEEKINILTSNVCEGILPISAGREGKLIYGYYDTAGYRRLSSYKEIDARNILTVAERTIEAIERCSEHLFFAEEYLITLDTVYIDSHFKNVRFAYTPDRDEAGGTKKLIYFITQLQQITTKAGKLYLEALKQMMSREEMSLLKLKYIVIIFKREIQKYNIN